MKGHDKKKELSYLKYWDINILKEWVKSQNLPENGFKWVENVSQFKKYFIENYNEDGDEGYFLEFDVKYPEKLHDFHNDLSFLPERKK